MFLISDVLFALCLQSALPFTLPLIHPQLADEVKR
jgi:hypothetical protein